MNGRDLEAGPVPCDPAFIAFLELSWVSNGKRAKMQLA